MDKRREDLTGLIDKLLESEDPATVGLRRIIRQKRDSAEDFPMQAMLAEDFSKQSSSSSSGRVFSADEKRIMELEREVLKNKSDMENIRRQAASDAENARAKALVQGRSEGIREGHAKAQAEFDVKYKDLAKRIASYINGIESRRSQLFTEVHSDALMVAMTAVKRIISAEASAQTSEVALRVIKSAMSYIADRKNLVIRLNPADLASVDGKSGLWATVTDQLDNLKVLPDERITRGGCTIESSGGLIDARMETQIAAIEDLVTGLWAESFSSKDFDMDLKQEKLSEIFPEMADADNAAV